MKLIQWKREVLLSHIDNPQAIGRATAQYHGVPWATMWDFKQKLINGVYEKEAQGPKILLFDIETAPMVVHNWSLFQNYTNINQIMQDWFMLSWSAKWLGDSNVSYDGLNEHQAAFLADPTNDYHIVKALHKLLDEADIIVGHNLNKFDDKKVKARFLFHGLPPVSPYRKVDTLLIARRQFALSSNKLDFLATYLGFENKVDHEGHTLWVKCMSGDKKAWATMKEYNIYDTILLEKVYKAVRGWDNTHPNVAVYYNDLVRRCNVCGSDNVKSITSTANTNTSKFGAFRCGECKHISRDGDNQLDRQKRKSLVRNVV